MHPTPSLRTRMSSVLYRRVALPVVDLARRTDSIAAYRELERTQWLPTAELRQLQLLRLRALLRHAGERVPYYRDLFAELGFDPEGVRSVADLEALPTLDKATIRAEGERLMADNAEQYQPRPHRSAGTTGQPLVIQMDRARHSLGWADMYRWWAAGGWQPGDKQLVLAGSALRPRQISGLQARIYGRLNHFVEFTSFDLTESELDRALAAIVASPGLTHLRGYASSIHLLARHASSVGWKANPRRRLHVYTTAETLFPEQRARIEEYLGAHVFDQWGCRDGGISAFECDRHQGMHVAIENAVVEFVCDGRAVLPGESGEVLATDLFSYAMPMIRYRVGDRATPSDRHCSCGRGLPLIESVDGRVSGFLIGSGGKRVHGEFFSHVFWEAPWVEEFQIVQEVRDEVVVRIVPTQESLADGLDEELRQIGRVMEEQLGVDTRVRLQIVSKIEAGPMGKRQFVVCKVPDA